jgi:hypothetical protein
MVICMQMIAKLEQVHLCIILEYNVILLYVLLIYIYNKVILVFTASVCYLGYIYISIYIYPYIYIDIYIYTFPIDSPNGATFSIWENKQSPKKTNLGMHCESTIWDNMINHHFWKVNHHYTQCIQLSGVYPRIYICVYIYMYIHVYIYIFPIDSPNVISQ